MSRSSIIARASCVVLCAFSVRKLGAQEPAGGGRAVLHSATYQIAAAVTPLPEEMRAGAAVLGYTAIGKAPMVLREGKNDMICLLPDAQSTVFYAVCYHKVMAPVLDSGWAR